MGIDTVGAARLIVVTAIVWAGSDPVVRAGLDRLREQDVVLSVLSNGAINGALLAIPVADARSPEKTLRWRRNGAKTARFTDALRGFARGDGATGARRPT